MREVSLNHKLYSKELNQLLVIVSITDMVKQGLVKWFGHLERKSIDEWVSARRGDFVTQVEEFIKNVSSMTFESLDLPFW